MITKIILFDLFLFIILIFQFKVSLKTSELHASLHLKKENIYFGFFFSVVFLFFFVFLFRLSRIYYNNSVILDLKKYAIFFSYIDPFLITFLFIFIFFILVLLKRYVVAFFKMHFLNFYFYFCRDYSKYFQYFSYADDLILNFFPKKFHIHLSFFFKYFLKFIVFFFLVKNLIFDNYCIDLFLMPYYGIYYLFLNIMAFFKKFKIDFDQGFCMHLKKLTFFKNIGYLKLYEYQKYLINNSSDFIFFNDFEKLDLKYNKKVYFYLFSIDYDFFKFKEV